MTTFIPSIFCIYIYCIFQTQNVKCFYFSPEIVYEFLAKKFEHNFTIKYNLMVIISVISLNICMQCSIMMEYNCILKSSSFLLKKNFFSFLLRIFKQVYAFYFIWFALLICKHFCLMIKVNIN